MLRCHDQVCRRARLPRGVARGPAQPRPGPGDREQGPGAGSQHGGHRDSVSRALNKPQEAYKGEIQCTVLPNQICF